VWRRCLPARYHSPRRESACPEEWRWTTPDLKVYRCSDGFSTFWGGGYTGQTYLTICRAAL